MAVVSLSSQTLSAEHILNVFAKGKQEKYGHNRKECTAG